MGISRERFLSKSGLKREAVLDLGGDLDGHIKGMISEGKWF